MIFSRARNITDDSLHITTFTGHSIERVSVYKYLGIWLDQKLTFKFHIDILASKLKHKIGYLYRHKLNFPLLCRKQIIEAVFLSVLDYGDVIYRHASASTLTSLDSIYHSALHPSLCLI